MNGMVASFIYSPDFVKVKKSRHIIELNSVVNFLVTTSTVDIAKENQSLSG